MKLIIANAAVALLVNAQGSLREGDRCKYGTRFSECGEGLKCGIAVSKNIKIRDYLIDQNVRSFYEDTNGKRFSTVILTTEGNGARPKRDNNAERFINVNGKGGKNPRIQTTKDGFTDYQRCAGKQDKALGQFTRPDICESECLDEISLGNDSRPASYCCQIEWLHHDGEKGYDCVLYSQSSTQWAKFDKSNAICIRDDPVVGDEVGPSNNRKCGQEVDRNSDRYWRCDNWDDRPTLQDYKNNLDMDALRRYEADLAADKNNINVQKYVTKPTGWTLQSSVSLNDIGLSNFILNEIEKDPDSKFASGDCEADKWCTRDRGTAKMRSCSLNVVFKEGYNLGESRSRQILKPKLITERCLVHDRCEEFNDNGDIRTFNACPQIQCPAYTYRSGLYNPEYNFETGEYVYRSYEKVTSREDSLTEYRNAFVSRADGRSEHNDWDSQPVQKIIDGNRYYPVIIPFQCSPDYCERKDGMFVKQGNTDTGQLSTDEVEGEGVRDRERNLEETRRLLIPPRYILTSVIKYNERNGEAIPVRDQKRSQSADQGRCGQCKAYERAFDRQPVWRHQYLRDRNMVKENGVLIDSNYQPPTAHFVSKGCERCPDFHKRDNRRTINGRTNPNYGDCYRPVCPNGGILIKGDRNKRDRNWDRQGECEDPPCKEYEKRQRDGVCRPDTCRYGQYNLRIDDNSGSRRLQGECVQCRAGQTSRLVTYSPRTVSRNERWECEDCRLPNYIDRDGRCASCDSRLGLVYDEDARGCKCDYWTRRQRDGICKSDDCTEFERIVEGRNSRGGRESDPQQGRCVRCGTREKSTFDRRRCELEPLICGPDKVPYTAKNRDGTQCVEPDCTRSQRYPNSQFITRFGECQDCPSGRNDRFLTTRLRQRDRCDECQRPRIFNRERGTCTTCPARTEPNFDYTACLDCPSNKVWSTSQNKCVCKACPAYTTSFSSRDGECSECRPCSCGPNSKYPRVQDQKCNINGSCTDCPPYETLRLTGNLARKECYRRVCRANEVLNINGECESCSACQLINSQTRQCYRPRCTGRQTLNVNGICETCADYSFIDQTRLNSCGDGTCTPRQCYGNQYITRTGEYRSCGRMQRVNSSCRGCEPIVCGPNEAENESGTGCTQCDQCSLLNRQTKKCYRPKCLARSSLQIDGSCRKCEDYTYLDMTRLNSCGEGTCVQRQCYGNNQYITRLGEYATCGRMQRVTKDCRGCEPIICGPNEIENDAGTGCISCSTYGQCFTQVNGKCQDRQCPLDSIRNAFDCTCKKCGRYSRPNRERTECIKDPCNNRQYFSLTGTCLPCKPCMVAIPGQTSCDYPNCGNRDIITQDGECSTCPIFQKPSSLTAKCGATCTQCTPSARQCLKENGDCLTCPNYTRCQGGGFTNRGGNRLQSEQQCGPDLCQLREKLMLDGTCSQCPDYTRGAGIQQQGQYTQCLPCTPKNNEVIRKDGTCGPCDPFQKAEPGNRGCYLPKCKPERTHFLKQDAEFYKCPDWTRADVTCRFCRPDPCTMRQRLLINGQCQNCPPFQRASKDGRSCEEYTCGPQQKVLSDGLLEECPPFTRSSPDCRKCIAPTCHNRQRILPTGICEDCEPYTRAFYNQRSCAPCIPTQREIIKEDGTCEKCKDYNRAMWENKKCGSIPCNARQLLQIDGRCVNCYPYTRASADGKSCIPHECKDTERLDENGGCTACPKYTRAQGDGTKCGPDTCSLRQRILEDGTCQYCPLYSMVCKDQRCCTQAKCGVGQVKYKDGTCQDCAFHEMVSPDGLSCVIDPTKKLPDPVPAPTVLVTTTEPACCTTAGCDVWDSSQMLQEDQAAGLQFNPTNNALSFLLGNAMKISAFAASLLSAALIVANAI